MCIVIVKVDEYSIYVEYVLDDVLVEFLDILNVVYFDEIVNVYID